MIKTTFKMFIFLIVLSFMPNDSHQADQYSIKYDGCQPTQAMKNFDMNRVN